MTNYIKRKKGLNCTNRVLAAGLSDLQRAEATVEFMNLFRQMLNEARFFSHDERSLRGYLIEDIEKKKLKAEELLNGLGLCVRWGFPALKPNSSTNLNLSKND